MRRLILASSPSVGGAVASGGASAATEGSARSRRRLGRREQLRRRRIARRRPRRWRGGASAGGSAWRGRCSRRGRARAPAATSSFTLICAPIASKFQEVAGSAGKTPLGRLVQGAHQRAATLGRTQRILALAGGVRRRRRATQRRRINGVTAAGVRMTHLSRVPRRALRLSSGHQTGWRLRRPDSKRAYSDGRSVATIVGACTGLGTGEIARCWCW